jgi:hypothetical protein
LKPKLPATRIFANMRRFLNTYRTLPLWLLLTGMLFLFITRLDAQHTVVTDTINAGEFAVNNNFNQKSYKPWLTGGAIAIFSTGSLLALNDAWYKAYSRTAFHTFNDSKEWLQVDKAGHMWSVYTLSRHTGSLWKWAGMDDKNAVLAGSLSSLAYLTAIEFMDGHSAKWGWSWADITANAAGAGLYATQAFLWNEQRLSLKFSAHKETYDASLDARANDLFGRHLTERLLKDYNNQTYWLSVNLKSFIPRTTLPPWLNLAAGYGAAGMLGGFDNSWSDRNGVHHERPDIVRTRQFYLSPDIDFTKINTQKKTLKVMFEILNSIKIPAPALMINSKGKLRAYALYF